MNTSSSSKRKLLPCIPDVSYHIQLVFILTFSYIWYNAINTDYLEDLSDKPQEYIDEIDVSPQNQHLLITLYFFREQIGGKPYTRAPYFYVLSHTSDL